MHSLVKPMCEIHQSPLARDTTRGLALVINQDRVVRSGQKLSKRGHSLHTNLAVHASRQVIRSETEAFQEGALHTHKPCRSRGGIRYTDTLPSKRGHSIHRHIAVQEGAFDTQTHCRPRGGIRYTDTLPSKRGHSIHRHIVVQEGAFDTQKPCRPRGGIRYTETLPSMPVER